MEPIYMSTTEMAKVLEISSSTLRRMVRDKKIQAFRPPGGHFRFDLDKTVQAYWKIEGEESK